MAKSNGTEGLKQSAQAKRVNLAEWRASRVHELSLPSGLQVKVRDVTMTDLMLTGKLPEGIMGMMTDLAQSGAQEADLGLVTKNAQEFNALLNALVQLCLVEPKIGDTADDEHILLAEIPSDDKLTLFNFLNRGAEQVRPFREGEAEPVEAV